MDLDGWYGSFKATEKKERSRQMMKNTLKMLLVGLLVILVLAAIVLSWVPPVSRDALTHHLAVPKLYLKHGGIYEIPEIKFSYYPMNLDLLYLIPLYFENDIVPKYIHFAFALLTAGLIFGYLKRRLGAIYALAGAVFFLSTPVILKLSISAYVDLGLIFFSFAAIIQLFKWHESGFKTKHLLFSALFCGLALGTKYNGLVVFFLLTLMVVYIARKKPLEKYPTGLKHVQALKYAGIFIFLSLLVFSPWMMRNFVWTGNPIYPLYNKWFISNTAKPLPTSDTSDLSVEIKKKTGGWSHFAIRRILYGESWARIAIVPLRIFFEGQDDKPQFFDGKLNPFLLLLPLFAFIGIGRQSSLARFELRLLVTFAVLFILIAFLKTSIRIRYIAPVIPPLVVVSIFGLQNMVLFVGKHRRTFIRRGGTALVIVAVLLMFYVNAAYTVKQFDLVKPFDYISGGVGRDDYITRHRPEFPVVKYANKNLAQKARVLGLFLGNRAYYWDRDLVFGDAQFDQALTRSESVQALSRWLKEHGYTHLVIRFDILKQWFTGLENKERRILTEFLNRNLDQLYSRGGYGLYQLNSD